eukprot:Skav226798  [mRNA]  locus=scaffold2056:10396:12013:+ [translate_table: standard]
MVLGDGFLLCASTAWFAFFLAPDTFVLESGSALALSLRLLMSSLLPWLSPEVLSTSVQLLEGQVPSPAAKLSSALKKASNDDCLGLLADSSLRSAFAQELDSSSLKEISAQSGKQLVEVFGQVLNKQLDALKGPLSFNQVLSALNGQEPSQASQVG